MLMTLENLMEAKKQKSRAEDKVSRKTLTLLTHLAKIWLYPTYPKDHNHWSGEVSDRLIEMGEIKDKFKNEKFIRNHTFRKNGSKANSTFVNDQYDSPMELLNDAVSNAVSDTSDINDIIRDGYEGQIDTFADLVDEFITSECHYLEKHHRFTNATGTKSLIYELLEKYFHDDYKKIDEEYYARRRKRRNSYM